ncbi:DUF58 domain-containing protein [Novosphingobium beihaiensis]|uniref:DUF58 domain-containing protein n=1 Tax=Novosphingobium beihaiensis TaxID=2930389 RepID=A0ABT0BL76_9SPHN|nr:DUF58 domain-containing protein [Novosphingobium beihaiensis]MCJ2185794.1 DUF58 domain-containing protein [Novosphingobium beihaiensis]
MNPGLRFEELFDPAFLARLEPFTLRIAQAQKGGRLADQRTSARGQGSDFADFKPYVAGDDLRAIDWNIYRRLGRAFVKVFEERQDMPVYFLLDLSRSMFLENPPRIHAALRATLALGAIALSQHDSVSLFPFSDNMTMEARGISGRNNVIQIARRLSGLEAMGGTALADSASKLAAMKLRQGLVVVVSDFFDEAGLDSVLRSLGRLPHRLLLVQLTRAADADPSLDPDLWGDVAIENGENDSRIELTITPQLLERYRSAYRTFNDTLVDFVRGRGTGLIQVDAGKDVLDALSQHFTGGALTL